MVPTVAPDFAGSGPGDEGPWETDTRAAGRVPSPAGSGPSDRGATPAAGVGRGAGTPSDRPLGARPLGGRGGQAAPPRPLSSSSRSDQLPDRFAVGQDRDRPPGEVPELGLVVNSKVTVDRREQVP